VIKSASGELDDLKDAFSTNRILTGFILGDKRLDAVAWRLGGAHYLVVVTRPERGIIDAELRTKEWKPVKALFEHRALRQQLTAPGVTCFVLGTLISRPMRKNIDATTRGHRNLKSSFSEAAGGSANHRLHLASVCATISCQRGCRQKVVWPKGIWYRQPALSSVSHSQKSLTIPTLRARHFRETTAS